jgi:hypothetical protein
MAAADRPKTSAREVAERTLDGVEAGEPEVLADERARAIKAALSDDQQKIYPDLQVVWEASASAMPRR